MAKSASKSAGLRRYWSNIKGWNAKHGHTRQGLSCRPKKGTAAFKDFKKDFAAVRPVVAKRRTSDDDEARYYLRKQKKEMKRARKEKGRKRKEKMMK